MFKKSFLITVLTLFSLSKIAYAEDVGFNTEAVPQKSFKKYLFFKTKILDSRSEARKTLTDIKNLGRIERWSGNKVQQEGQEVEDTLRLLGNYNKSFANYQAKEFEIDFATVEKINKTLEKNRTEIAAKIATHKEIAKSIKGTRKQLQDTYETTYKLYVIRKNIEFFYKSKYPNAAPTPLEYIEKRLKTKELLEEIENLNPKIDALAKEESDGFATNETFSAESVLQNLQGLSASLTAIQQQSLSDIKEDRITEKSFAY